MAENTRMNLAVRTGDGPRAVVRASPEWARKRIEEAGGPALLEEAMPCPTSRPSRLYLASALERSGERAAAAAGDRPRSAAVRRVIRSRHPQQFRALEANVIYYSPGPR